MRRCCPLGRLSSELAESDPAARAALSAGLGQWHQRLTAGLETMQQRGGLAEDADAGALALGLLAAAQSGLLLAQRSRARPGRSRSLWTSLWTASRRGCRRLPEAGWPWDQPALPPYACVTVIVSSSLRSATIAS